MILSHGIASFCFRQQRALVMKISQVTQQKKLRLVRSLSNHYWIVVFRAMDIAIICLILRGHIVPVDRNCLKEYIGGSRILE